ncbi:gamma-glutamyltransferase [Roseiterribacter gracilis]|uniref:Glutathione hydrolase proenzyme n=1 Tax=Roseiterribacter gracilis TaxID=2812848 RepID=A0A8S8XEK0_9PROT|nr:gamma-glutamyltranspeptidase [Rhodospirillales bacterium TMPK1]
MTGILGQPLAATAADIGRGDRLTGLKLATRSPVVAPHGAAATSQPLATQVAIQILQKGGSAIDAAIAANATLGLMEPTGSGIGGDLYAIVWDPKTKKLYGYNGSGRSPKGLDLAKVKTKGDAQGFLPQYGAISVTVPGTVDGWFALHGKFGKLPMKDLLAPAIGYAKDGFPWSQYIGMAIARSLGIFETKHKSGELEEIDNARKLWMPDGTAPREGQMFRNPDLAKTYEAIAAGGRDAFYKGAIAKTVSSYMQRIGGWLREEDFAAHQGEWVEPVSTKYRGVDVWELPPNTQGIATLQMLNLMEGYDLKAMGAGSADALHVMIEAKKIAYADRAKLYADLAAMTVPVESLVSKSYANERRKLIRMDKALEAVEAGAPTGHGGTIYLTVADKDGMMVSWIQSNFRGPGSGLVPDGLGFMLQDRGGLFVTTDGHPNQYAPSKRPFHTIIPGFATKDGEPWLSFGVMGGAMQPQGHVQILANLIDFGMDVQEAGDAARWQHFGSGTADDPHGKPGGEIVLESGIPAASVEELKKRGHAVRSYGSGKEHYGSYEAILWDAKEKVYRAATESRVDGMAAGY